MDASITPNSPGTHWRAVRLLVVLLLAPLCWGADVLAISSVSSAAAATAAIPISAIDEAPATQAASASTRGRSHLRRRRHDDPFSPLPSGRLRASVLRLAPMRIRLMPPLWRGPPVLRL